MIKKIHKYINNIWKAEGHDDINTSSNENAEFVLMYKDLPIGTLLFLNGVWKFSYTERFRQQNEIAPLIDFPNTSQEYESSQLWPFFSYRIPGLNQPSVQEIIKRESIQKNVVELLKRFGQTSVSNPFFLRTISH